MSFVAHTALNQKLNQNKSKNTIQSFVWDKIIFKKTKSALGGNVRLACTGGAPISSEVLRFLKVTLCTSILEGYGQTESTGLSFHVNMKDPEVGHVGGVGRQTEFKLVDIPEM